MHADPAVQKQRSRTRYLRSTEKDAKTIAHVPESEGRDDANQAIREVDDIFTLLTFLEENLLLTDLPMFH